MGWLAALAALAWWRSQQGAAVVQSASAATPTEPSAISDRATAWSSAGPVTPSLDYLTAPTVKVAVAPPVSASLLTVPASPTALKPSIVPTPPSSILTRPSPLFAAIRQRVALRGY